MKEVRPIQNRQPVNPRHPLTVADVYYVLFRQKWKILFFCVLGAVAAFLIYRAKPPAYESDAKLFIRYVLDNKTAGPASQDKVKSPDDQGGSIVNSEIEILTSFDLALQVADLIGPEKILAKSGGGRDRVAAAAVIAANMNIDVPNKGSVLRVSFRSADPDLVQPVLGQIIESYFKKHVEIHQAAGGYDEYLTQQADQLRSRLSQTEQDLRKARLAVGVISLEDTKKAYSEQIAKIRAAIFDTEADLAERQAVLKEIVRLIPVSTNATPIVPVVATEVPAGEADEYKSLLARLDLLWKRQEELLTQYTADTPMVKRVQEQIADAEKQRKKMETDNPQLVAANTTPARTTEQRSGPAIDLTMESARITALQTKIKVLYAQLDQIRAESTNMDANEAGIVELQRKRELEEANYSYFSKTLEQSRFDEALGAGKLSNISVIQQPSPPARDSVRTLKVPALAALGCIAAGFALAFFLELKLDSSVKRSVDIESKLHLPLFLTIPRVKVSKAHHVGNGAADKPRLLAGPGGEPPADEPAGEPAPAGATASAAGLEKAATPGANLWSRDPALNPYYEALRDRIILDFEIRNLTHTPKLIAVTGCNKGAGVTTVALGLAASLSETGAGNVLLVDMNRGTAAAQQFYKGKTVCGLDEALQVKGSAQVQNNLYVVSETPNGDNVPHILPRRFTNLVPKLRASDYDYIIFDMPPVSPTSVTGRIAGFMDQVLLVVESEKTDREIVQKAAALLAESKASVSAVLNKTRTYVPRLLHKEF
jgi:uncharacterized protein involved in exopolysaccharide biosynthesis/Mrp family chromosome partitioning ATPase